MKKLLPTLRLSLDMTNVLAKIEHAGIKVNLETLNDIRNEYEHELTTIDKRLKQIVSDVMGDTPINLNSADDRSMLFYSRKINNKETWTRTFNIGHEMRGATRKIKMRKKMSKELFARTIRNNTEVIKKTTGYQCGTCEGVGRVRFKLKNGQLGKANRLCKNCNATGVVYSQSKQVAGLRIVPRNTKDVAQAGFKTDKTTLEEMLPALSGAAKEFVELYVRYSALRTYLSTFVEGMENNVDENNFIHPEFMQCITATGRLSSRNPNFQNMPRGSTFRIRKVVESRFEGGSIIEGDYSQLEFRVAGFLANDSQIYKDVKDGVDVHAYTASVIGCDRQTAKADTFKPLYGGVTGTPDQQKYYRAFKAKYEGVTEWHDKLQREAVQTKQIMLPSGRRYCFPDVQWTTWGTATNRTAICNYPVQGFATADILPCCLVELDKRLQPYKSLICNTVHDSIVIDCHPDEELHVLEILKVSMLGVATDLQKRYKIKYLMPVEIEIKKGKNWLDTEVVYPVE